MSEDKKLSKRQHAVALQYGENDSAPRIVATGAGEIAKRILGLAKEHDIPIREDDTLVDILSKLDLGYEIPPETYRAVAEILAFLYRTDAEWRAQRKATVGAAVERGNPQALNSAPQELTLKDLSSAELSSADGSVEPSAAIAESEPE